MESQNSWSWNLDTVPVEIWSGIALYLEAGEVMRLWATGSTRMWSRFCQLESLSIRNQKASGRSIGHHLMAPFKQLRSLEVTYNTDVKRRHLIARELEHASKHLPAKLETLKLTACQDFWEWHISHTVLPSLIKSKLTTLSIQNLHIDAESASSAAESLASCLKTLEVFSWPLSAPLPPSLTSFQTNYIADSAYNSSKVDIFSKSASLLHVRLRKEHYLRELRWTLVFSTLPPNLLTLHLAECAIYPFAASKPLPPSLTDLQIVTPNGYVPQQALPVQAFFQLTRLSCYLPTHFFRTLPHTLTDLSVQGTQPTLAMSDIAQLPVGLRNLSLACLTRRLRAHGSDPVLPFRHLEKWDAPEIDLTYSINQVEVLAKNPGLTFFGAPIFRPDGKLLSQLPASLRHIKVYTGMGAIHLYSTNSIVLLPPLLAEWHLDLDKPTQHADILGELPADFRLPHTLCELHLRLEHGIGILDSTLATLLSGNGTLRVFSSNAKTISDDGILHFKVPSLTSLTLTKAKLSPACFKHLPRDLRLLCLSGCHDDPKKLFEDLPPKLESLTLGGSKIDHSVLPYLPKQASITFVYLSANCTLKHAFTRELPANMTKAGTIFKTQVWKHPNY